MTASSASTSSRCCSGSSPSSSRSPTSRTRSAPSTRSARWSRWPTRPVRSCSSTARRPCRTCRSTSRSSAADFYAFSGHKMLAPMGSGALWARRELLEAMPPFLAGGEMIREVHLRRSEFNEIPWKFEAGTPAVGDAIGLGRRGRVPHGHRHGRRPRARARARRLRARGPAARGPRRSSCTGRWTRTSAAASSRSTCPASTRTTWPRSWTATAIAVRAGHHCTMPLHERLDLAATARASFNVYSTTRRHRRPGARPQRGPARLQRVDRRAPA